MKRLIVNVLALWQVSCVDTHGDDANTADCANPIIDPNQKVRGIDIHPGRIKLCKQLNPKRNPFP